MSYTKTAGAPSEILQSTTLAAGRVRYSVEGNPVNLATNLENSAFFFAHHSVISDDGIEITCGELNDRASLVASGLAVVGVNLGDYIGLFA
jgi:hypothetical protein